MATNKTKTNLQTESTTAMPNTGTAGEVVQLTLRSFLQNIIESCVTRKDDNVLDAGKTITIGRWKLVPADAGTFKLQWDTTGSGSWADRFELDSSGNITPEGSIKLDSTDPVTISKSSGLLVNINNGVTGLDAFKVDTDGYIYCGIDDLQWRIKPTTDSGDDVLIIEWYNGSAWVEVFRVDENLDATIANDLSVDEIDATRFKTAYDLVGGLPAGSTYVSRDSSDIGSLELYTLDGAVTLETLANGVVGQELTITGFDGGSGSSWTIVNNSASAGQKIFTTSGSNITGTSRAVYRFWCDGTNWYQIQ